VIWCLAASAAEWEEANAAFGFPRTAEWTNEVELADVDGDGHVDLLFANGAGYSTPERAEASRLFVHPDPAGPLVEAPRTLLGDPGHARSVKARDFDGDGFVDVFLAMTYQEPARLLLGDGAGGLVASTSIPTDLHDLGDAEPADVDLDGDLDLVLADWGADDALSNGGGPVVLWRNDGGGVFTDVTATAMPPLRVGMSWDLEVADVDQDRDLDVLVSCKVCTGSVLLVNDGTGTFTDASTQLPQAGNNYDFELMDLDGDDDLDVVTINDGPRLRESVWLNDGAGTFVDATATWLPDSENSGLDDNVSCFVDADGDGDADWLIGSLSDPDRVLFQDGGVFRLETDVLDGPRTFGTLAMALADLDEDGRIDLVTAQGEVLTPEHVWRGVDVPVDAHAPVVTRVALEADVVRARIHDRKTPVAAHDFVAVVRTQLGDTPLFHHGGMEFSAALPAGARSWQVCATDRQGNEACSVAEPLVVDSGTPPAEHTGQHTGEVTEVPEHTGLDHTGALPTSTADEVREPKAGGCGCDQVPGRPWAALALAGLLVVRRGSRTSRGAAPRAGEGRGRA
jgi:hypothetical protein